MRSAFKNLYVLYSVYYKCTRHENIKKRGKRSNEKTRNRRSYISVERCVYGAVAMIGTASELYCLRRTFYSIHLHNFGMLMCTHEKATQKDLLSVLLLLFSASIQLLFFFIVSFICHAFCMRRKMRTKESRSRSLCSKSFFAQISLLSVAIVKMIKIEMKWNKKNEIVIKY